MRLLAFLVCIAGPALGQSAEVVARDAMLQLTRAHEQLVAADTAQDRIHALTGTVQAYEAGLAAMRSGLRQVQAREDALSADLLDRQAEVGNLLGVLATISHTPQPVLRGHPQGAVDAVRAGMLVSDVTAGLQAQATALQTQLARVQQVRALRVSATQTLEDGLQGAQDARIALGQAVSERDDLPKRFEEDPVQTALMMASSQTLGDFADALAQGLPDPETTLNRQGNLPLPVAGIVQGIGAQSDGIYIAAQAGALVTAPVTATLLYRGPLLDDLNVVILEPAPDVLFVIAGLDTLYGEVGQIVPAGTPLGHMPRDATEVNGILTEIGADPASAATQPLYLEVREGQSPVSPDAWFALE